MLKRLFRPRPAVAAGRALFRTALAASRAPALYERFGVPDTVEARFELLLAQVVLLIHRMRPAEAGPGAEREQARETSQVLFDDFLQNLDDGLREMGVGDIVVGKRMRKLAEAIYGRAKAYEPALDAVPDLAPLSALVGRTVFGAEGDPRAHPLAAHLAASKRALEAQPLEAVFAGRASFADPLAA